MPKASPNQTSFSGGEFSPLVQGRVDTERYKTGLEVTLNYIPTLQGPLIRRPGTKYVANVKDPSKPPTLVPFQFSVQQSYMLEFGNWYVRVLADEAQVIVTSNAFKVSGFTGLGNSLAVYSFDSVRDTNVPREGETFNALGSSVILPAGSVVEFQSPYSYLDAPNVKTSQNQDTVYLTHPLYPVHKIQRYGNSSWDIKQVIFKDGPYLPLNSYKTLSDSTKIFFTPAAAGFGLLTAGPNYSIYGTANNGQGEIRLTLSSPHVFSTGDKVFVAGVQGTVGANNGTSSISATYWTAKNISSTVIDLIGSTYSGAVTGSTGIVYPAIFQMVQAPDKWGDVCAITTGSSLIAPRNIAFLISGVRYWGHLTAVVNPATATLLMDGTVLPNTSAITTWQMGVWSGVTGFPSTSCFHQDRLAFAGVTNYPQQIDLSKNGDYETFAASGSNLQVADNNAVSIKLLSAQSNPIKWIKSSAQGLLAGSESAEWQVTPNNQNAALTPTNVSANQTSFFGSANVDAVQAGNAVLYVQGASRKVREMNYFFQVGTFRSTDLTELSEHITIPGVTRLAVQKEPLPLVWATRSDGVLLSMSYNRDDQTIKAGWARHILGGRSDSGGAIPQVQSIGVITASSATSDQLWMTVKRYVNGTSVVTVETMTSPYNDSMPQADGYCLDGGATFENPKPVENIIFTNGLVEVVSSFLTPIVNGSSVLITDVVGLNTQRTDVNEVVTSSSLVNGRTFIIASASLISFYLQDFEGGFISASSYSPYVSGGFIRQLITRVSGVTWLKNETVGVLTDGGIHQDVVINSAGVLTTQYPAAKIQFGYRYNSDGSTLRADVGAAAGSSIGMLRRIVRAAFLLHQVGDFSFGPNFARLIPCEFPRADEQQADQPTSLFSGITRDSIESMYDFDDQLVFRQNSGLPGMVQSIMTVVDEIDV